MSWNKITIDVCEWMCQFAFCRHLCFVYSIFFIKYLMICVDIRCVLCQLKTLTIVNCWMNSIEFRFTKVSSRSIRSDASRAQIASVTSNMWFFFFFFVSPLLFLSSYVFSMHKLCRALILNSHVLLQFAKWFSDKLHWIFNIIFILCKYSTNICINC